MKLKTFAVPVLCIVLVACNTSADIEATSDSNVVSASMADLSVLEGEAWTGSLSYLNYNSPSRSTIPVAASFSAVSDTVLQYEIQFPDEPQHNATESLTLSETGRRIDGHQLITREVLADGTLRLVTEGDGEDNGKSAVIQTEYSIGGSQMILRKNIRYSDTDEFFNRNEFSLTR